MILDFETKVAAAKSSHFSFIPINRRLTARRSHVNCFSPVFSNLPSQESHLAARRYCVFPFHLLHTFIKRKEAIMTRFSILRYLLILFISASWVGSTHAEVMYSMQLKGSELPMGTLLEWATNLERDMATFVLERSTDGLYFEDVGTIQAAGFSSIDKAYHFMDVGASAKRTFYRLRELSSDGTASFSPVSTVDKKLENQFSVMAMTRTEVTKEFKITIDCVKEAELSWSILNHRNQSVDAGKKMLLNGLTDLVIETQGLTPGNYQVVLTLGTEVEKLVITRVLDEIADKPNVASTKKIPATGRN